MRQYRTRADTRAVESFPWSRVQELNTVVDDREAFLDWFDTRWRAAEVALHGGDADPRFQIWSDREPVTLFGAWISADNAVAVREVFVELAEGFSGTPDFEVELVAVEVSGDLAYTAHREITSTIVDGEPRNYSLRVTQVYRREGGEWKVVHRHADEEGRAASQP